MAIADIRSEAFRHDPIREYVDFSNKDEFIPRWLSTHISGEFQTIVAVKDDRVIGFLQFEAVGTLAPYHHEEASKDNATTSHVLGIEEARRLNIVNKSIEETAQRNLKGLEKYVYVHFLGVSPSSQGAGVGRLLMQEIFRLARAHNCIAYLESSTVGLPFYQRLGLRLLPRQDHAEIVDSTGVLSPVTVPIMMWEP